MRSIVAFLVALAFCVCSPAGVRADEKDKPGDDAARLAVAKAVAPALVRVEYTLRYDKGEPPQALGYSRMYYGGDAESVVRDERPFEVPGYVVAPDKVLVPDPVIHPRFVKSITVRQGDEKGGETSAATPASYAKDQGAVVLKLSQPLKSARPLAFDKSKKGPYLAITYSPGEGEWTTSVQPAGGTVVVTSRGRSLVSVPSYCLLTDAKGAPVGMAMRDDLPPDESWKGSPLDWPMMSAEQFQEVTGRIEKAVQQGLPRVTINFRSPKAKPGAGTQMRYGGNPDEDQNSTVRHVNGVMVDDKTVLVLAELKGNVTARLDSIRVNTPDGKSVPAKFGHTLLDYGAFVATLEKPLPGAAVKPATADVLDLRGKLLPAAHLQLQGERRRENFGHRRLQGFTTGWRRQVYPQVPGDSQNLFLFDADGSLVALPVGRRDKAGAQEQHHRFGSGEAALLTPVSYLLPALSGGADGKYADAGNVPLSEEDENRLAWLGVELQALTPDLARANEVSHLTNDGRSGALVTYVYPNSPAAASGVEPGWILLRIHVADQPRPIEVQIEPYAFGDQPFPWDRFDELPEQYFDRIPQPWPALENNLTRTLTDLGFGKKFTAEFSNGGKTLTKEFQVAQSPPHYDSAPKFKSDPVGVTVRDQTYEVRRYFHRSNEEPGVIVAKIEMGSRASIAGLKPFEVITHVNDQPVMDVKGFEKLTKGQETLRLSVKRMTKGRQVKVNVSAAKGEKAPQRQPGAPVPKEDVVEEPKVKED